MNICVVSGTFHPEPGGPPAFLYRLLPELVRRGHAVEVDTYGEADAPRDYPYRVTRISRRQPIPLRLPALARAVLAAGRRAEVFFVSDYGLPVALANIFLRRPIVLKNVGDFAWEFSTRHGWIPHGQTIDQFQTAPHSLRVKLLRRVQRWYTGAASVVVAPSHYSARLVVGWGIPAAKVKVIYNALDPVIGLPSREAAREQLALGGGPVLLTVARLVPWKGIDGLIRALPVIRQQYPAARLVIVGDGPERAALQAQAAPLGPAVQFTGALPPAQVWQHLRAADVFVLFSTYEGLPHTVLEAMQAGTPVVVSDAGGNVEVVTGGETGWVAPSGDERALAAAILEPLGNPARAAARAEAAALRLSRFSWETMVGEYEAVLRAVGR